MCRASLTRELDPPTAKNILSAAALLLHVASSHLPPNILLLYRASPPRGQVPSTATLHPLICSRTVVTRQMDITCFRVVLSKTNCCVWFVVLPWRGFWGTLILQRIVLENLNRRPIVNTTKATYSMVLLKSQAQKTVTIPFEPKHEVFSADVLPKHKALWFWW